MRAAIVGSPFLRGPRAIFRLRAQKAKIAHLNSTSKKAKSRQGA
jgi:hypothetical protein